MGKHGKKKDETSNNPIIRMRNAKDNKDKNRQDLDIEIVTKGWNNTQEADDYAILSPEEYAKKYHKGKGKHS